MKPGVKIRQVKMSKVKLQKMLNSERRKIVLLERDFNNAKSNCKSFEEQLKTETGISRDLRIEIADLQKQIDIMGKENNSIKAENGMLYESLDMHVKEKDRMKNEKQLLLSMLDKRPTIVDKFKSKFSKPNARR